MQVALSVLLSLVLAWASSTLALPEPGVTTIVLQHQDAREVAPILVEVLESRCCRPPRVSPPPAPVVIPERLRVQADVARNAVRLRGNPEAVREARTLLRRLDVPITAAR